MSGLVVWQGPDVTVARVGPKTLAVGSLGEVDQLVQVRLGTAAGSEDRGSAACSDFRTLDPGQRAPPRLAQPERSDDHVSARFSRRSCSSASPLARSGIDPDDTGQGAFAPPGESMRPRRKSWPPACKMNRAAGSLFPAPISSSRPNRPKWSRRTKPSNCTSISRKARPGCSCNASPKSSLHLRSAPLAISAVLSRALHVPVVIALDPRSCAVASRLAAEPTHTTISSTSNRSIRRSSSSCATPRRATSPATPFIRRKCPHSLGQQPRPASPKRKNFCARRHYGLKIWDAYRPLAAQMELWQRTHDGTFVADPLDGNGSLHTWGVAVDATLVDEDGAMWPCRPASTNSRPRRSCIITATIPS